MKLIKFTPTGTKSSLTVSDSIFAAAVNKILLSQAIRVYLSNKRQGTSKVKTRGEIARTKKKWFKQKGTGNARHGARSAPIFVGGGVAHGPKGTENWKLKLTPVLRKKALISALSAQAANIMIADEIMTLVGRTKQAQELVNKVAPEAKKVLVIVRETHPEMIRALRNLEVVLIATASRVSALEVALAGQIIMTSDAVEALEIRLGTKKMPASKETLKKEVAPKKVEKAVVKKETVKKTVIKVKKVSSSEAKTKTIVKAKPAVKVKSAVKAKPVTKSKATKKTK